MRHLCFVLFPLLTLYHSANAQIFLTKAIGQTNPITGASNTLTVTIETDTHLVAGDIVTISGLDNLAASSFSLQDLTGGGRFSEPTPLTYVDGTLRLTVASGVTVTANITHEFSFDIANPPMAQAAPNVTIEASGSVSFSSAPMNQPGTTVLGVTNGGNALYVVEAVFTVKSIEQSSPVAGASNTITATLQANCDLASGSTITITGLTGSQTADAGSLTVSTTSGHLGTAGAWTRTQGTLVLNSTGTTQATSYEVQFTLTNNAGDQAASTTVSVSGVVEAGTNDATIAGTAMTLSGTTVLGVAAGSDPLRTVLPTFHTKAIGQSNPLTSATNTLTITIQTNVDLATPGDVITISGLSNAVGGASLALTDVINSGGQLFSDGTTLGFGLYSAGTLALTVHTGQTVSAGTEYAFSMEIQNPTTAQAAPNITIEASGSVSFSPAPITQPGTTVLGVVNGGNALYVVAICDDGFSGPTNGPCEQCPANTFCSGGVRSECPGNSSAPAESNEATDCICNDGFSGPAGGPCVLCIVVLRFGVMREGNRAGTGSASVTMHGSGFGNAVATFRGLSMSTACEATRWFSDSGVRCLGTSGAKGTLEVALTVGACVSSLTAAFSYDLGTLSSVLRANDVATGSLGVTLTGRGFAAQAWTISGQTGKTSCAGTRWVSDTMVRCIVSAGALGTRGHAMTVGGRTGSLTEASTYGMAALSVARGANRAGTQSASVTVSGGGMRAESSNRLRISDSACEVTTWISETSMMCRVGTGAGRSMTAVLTTAGQVGSVTDGCSMDTVGLGVFWRANRAGTGSTSATVQGANMGLTANTGRLRGGQTDCEGTQWDSATSMRCQVAAGILLFGVKVVCTMSVVDLSLSEALTYDSPGIKSSSPVNHPTSGSIVVSGLNLGTSSYSMVLEVGQTGCEATEWASDSSMQCRLGRGSGKSLRATMTVGAGVGTTTNMASYDSVSGSRVGLGNLGTTGLWCLTVSRVELGVDMGTAFNSIMVQIGYTSCEATEWVSETSVGCRGWAGLMGTMSVVVTAGGGSESVSEAFSHDFATASMMVRGNAVPAGSTVVIVSGAGLGTSGGGSDQSNCSGRIDKVDPINGVGTYESLSSTCTSCWCNESGMPHRAGVGPSFGVWNSTGNCMLNPLTGSGRCDCSQFDGSVITPLGPWSPLGNCSECNCSADGTVYTPPMFFASTGPKESYYPVMLNPDDALCDIANCSCDVSGNVSETVVVTHTATKYNAAGFYATIDLLNDYCRLENCTCDDLGNIWAGYTTTYVASMAGPGLYYLTMEQNVSACHLDNCTCDPYGNVTTSYMTTHDTVIGPHANNFYATWNGSEAACNASSCVCNGDGSLNTTLSHSPCTSCSCFNCSTTVNCSCDSFGNTTTTTIHLAASNAGAMCGCGCQSITLDCGCRCESCGSLAACSCDEQGNSTTLPNTALDTSLATCGCECIPWLHDCGCGCNSCATAVCGCDANGKAFSVPNTPYDTALENCGCECDALVHECGCGCVSCEDVACHCHASGAPTLQPWDAETSCGCGCIPQVCECSCAREPCECQCEKTCDCECTLNENGFEAVNVSNAFSTGRVSDYTAGGELGATGCESTEWMSQTSLACKGAKGLLGTQAVVITVGERAGSVTEAVSFTSPVVSSAQMANCQWASTGSVLTASGSGLSITSYTSAARSTLTGCEASLWVSETSIACQSASGVAGTVRVSVTAGGRVGSMTEVVSFDQSLPRVVLENRASTGSVPVTVSGSGLGTSGYTVGGQMGVSGCEVSEWVSATSVACLGASGVSGTMQMGLTVGVQSGSVTEAVSFTSPVVSSAQMANCASTGSVLVTLCVGGGGHASYTSAAGFLSTGCEASLWVSDTSVVCLLGSGLGSSHHVSVTAGGSAGSMTEVVSVDRSMSKVVQGNRAIVGSVSLTVVGLGLGLTLDGRVGSSGCEASTWKSETSMLCLSAFTVAGTSRLSMTIGQCMGSVTESVSMDESLSSVVHQNKPSGGSLSIFVRGTGLGPASYSMRAAAGDTRCEATQWASHSAVACKAGAGIGGSLRALVSLGSHKGTVSEVVSFDNEVRQRIAPWNVPRSGHQSLILSGVGLSAVSESVVALLGHTVCEATDWASDSSVRCVVGGGMEGSLQTSVTAGGRSNTVTQGASYDMRSGSLHTCNAFRMVDTMVLVHRGNALNNGMEGTIALRLGETACEKTMWVSTSSVICTAARTVRTSQSIILSVQSRVGSLTRCWSGDMPHLTAPTQSNTPAASISAPIRLGTTACASSECFQSEPNPSTSPSGRLGFTHCEQTRWGSLFSILCTPGAGLGKHGLVILSASSCNPVSLSKAFTYDALLISAVHGCNIPQTGGVLVTLEGKGFGTTNASPKVAGGHTGCRFSAWTSDSSLACLAPSIGMWGSSFVTASVAVGVTTTSDSFSYDIPVCVKHSVYPRVGLALPSCQCVAGTTGRGDDVCRACRPGTYKEVLGSSSCTLCANGTFSTATGARNASLCRKCPINAQSEPGSWQLKNCTCKHGYFGEDGGPCSACPPGTFQIEEGARTCTSCPKDTYSSESAATSCLACPSDYFSHPGSSDVSNCSASATSYRFTTRTKSCSSQVVQELQVYRTIFADVAEVALSYVEVIYESIIVTTTCFEEVTSALFDVRLPETIASQSRKRLENDLGQKSEEANVPEMTINGTIPYCGNGRQPQGDLCAQCQRGWWKDGTKNESCNLCPANSDTKTVQTIFQYECKCNGGYSGSDGGNCTSCSPGAYKEAKGSAACSLCPQGTFLPSPAANSQRACLPCPSFSWSRRGSSAKVECLCMSGFTGANGEECLACSAGTYKPDIGPTPCLDCPAGSFAHGAASNCTLCPPGTFSESVRAPSLDFCSPCSANSWSSAGSRGRGDCKCNAGYAGPDGSSCAACQAGKYKSVIGSSPCEDCRADTFSDTLAATNLSACQSCAVGSYSPAGSAAAASCSSAVASYELGVSTTICVSSHTDESDYKEAFARIASLSVADVDVIRSGSPADCSSTLAFAFILPDVRAAAVLEMLRRNFTISVHLGGGSELEASVRVVYVREYCGNGRMPQLVEQRSQCVPCPQGWWKSATGNETCLPCPNNSDTTAVFSIPRTECKCNTGFTGADGMACAVCARGTFKDTIGSAGCTSCPVGTFSEEGATALSGCQACPFNRYRLEDDPEDPGAPSIVCVCQSDDWKSCAENQYFSCEVEGPVCRNCNEQLCAEGFFSQECSAFSDHDCRPCPLTKPANSDYDAEPCTWVCKDGFYEFQGQCFLCTTAACQLGWFRPRCTRHERPRADAQCMACTNRPENAIYVDAPAAVTSPCLWECVHGHFRNGSSDVCSKCSVLVCPPGQFHASCSPTQDSSCQSCSNTIPEHSRFLSQSSAGEECAWECNLGYITSGLVCLPDLAAFSYVEFDIELLTSREEFEQIENGFEQELALRVNATSVSAAISAQTFARRSSAITVKTLVLVAKPRVVQVTALLTLELLQSIFDRFNLKAMGLKILSQTPASTDFTTTPVPDASDGDEKPDGSGVIQAVTITVSVVGGVGVIALAAMLTQSAVHRWRRRAVVAAETPGKQERVSGFEESPRGAWRTQDSGSETSGLPQFSGEGVSSTQFGWERLRPCILAFFAQNRSDLLNTGGESQKLMNLLGDPPYFYMEPHGQPTVDDFHKALMTAKKKNVQLVHMAGHADTDEGFFFLKDETGLESEAAKIVSALKDEASSNGGTVECVILNACNTEDMAKDLRAAGMSHVICWRGKVHDDAAMEFSRGFYQSLQRRADGRRTSIEGRSFTQAFRDGLRALQVWQNRARRRSSDQRGRTGMMLAAGGAHSPDVVLLFSADGDDESGAELQGSVDRNESCTPAPRRDGVARSGSDEIADDSPTLQCRPDHGETAQLVDEEVREQPAGSESPVEKAEAMVIDSEAKRGTTFSGASPTNPEGAQATQTREPDLHGPPDGEAAPAAEATSANRRMADAELRASSLSGDDSDIDVAYQKFERNPAVEQCEYPQTSQAGASGKCDDVGGSVPPCVGSSGAGEQDDETVEAEGERGEAAVIEGGHEGGNDAAVGGEDGGEGGSNRLGFNEAGEARDDRTGEPEPWPVDIVVQHAASGEGGNVQGDGAGMRQRDEEYGVSRGASEFEGGCDGGVGIGVGDESETVQARVEFADGAAEARYDGTEEPEGERGCPRGFEALQMGGEGAGGRGAGKGFGDSELGGDEAEQQLQSGCPVEFVSGRHSSTQVDRGSEQAVSTDATDEQTATARAEDPQAPSMFDAAGAASGEEPWNVHEVRARPESGGGWGSWSRAESVISMIELDSEAVVDVDNMQEAFEEASVAWSHDPVPASLDGIQDHRPSAPVRQVALVLPGMPSLSTGPGDGGFLFSRPACIESLIEEDPDD